MSYRIVGIDWSLTGAGVARVIDGNIRTQRFSSVGHKGDSLDSRLARIRLQVRRVRDFALAGHEQIEGEPMPLFVIEAPAFAANGGLSDERAGGRWILIHLLRKAGLVVEVAPTTAKSYMCSNGRASKEDMISGVTHALNVRVSSHDEADALTLAAMGSRRLGRPLEVRTSRIRVTALESVQWPQLVERPFDR